MTKESQSADNLYTQIEISADTEPQSEEGDGLAVQNQILRQLLTAMDRQNELLEELISQNNASQRQRAHELKQWKKAHPELAKNCRSAAELLGKVQAVYLERLTDEVAHQGDCLEDAEFVFTEFVDRFGPRLAHLNGILQLLGQLSSSSQQQNR